MESFHGPSSPVGTKDHRPRQYEVPEGGRYEIDRVCLDEYPLGLGDTRIGNRCRRIPAQDRSGLNFALSTGKRQLFTGSSVMPSPRISRSNGGLQSIGAGRIQDIFNGIGGGCAKGGVDEASHRGKFAKEIQNAIASTAAARSEPARICEYNFTRRIRSRNATRPDPAHNRQRK